LADRSELTKLVLQAPPAQLRHLVGRLAGTELAVGGAVLAGGAWWCGQPDGSVLVLCEPATGVRVRERLLSHSLFHVSLTVSDRSEEWAAIALIGRATPKVLAALHVYGTSGDPRQAAPFTRAAVDGIEASWLLESDHRALALVPRAHATGAWRAIEAAGRPFGISCIGHDAASRYALLERIEQRAA
jgi:glycine cleavage system aminomethyltransferase T